MAAESYMTMGQVLERLRAENQLTPEQVERCAGFLEYRNLHETPWYIKGLTAIGAIIAAGIFASFASLVGYVIGPVPLGLLFVAGALILTYAIQNAFFRDMAIAFSIGGQFAIFVGIADFHILDRSQSNIWQLAIAAILLCAALYPFFTSAAHRFITSSIAIYLTIAWVLEADQPHLLHLLILAEAVGASMMLANARYYRWMKPLAYALATALPVTVVALTAVSGDKSLGDLKLDVSVTPLWPSNIILAAGILVLLWWVADEAWSLVSEPVIIALVAAVALAALTTPGILVGLGMLLIGYALGDRLIVSLGAIFLPLFLGYYYYELNVSLLEKSGILAASGFILLAVRFLVDRRPWAESETS